MIEQTRVIVVGAGLSGLTAARQLLTNSNCSVTVLQANDYVGGRTKTLNVQGVPFDLGAQFIGPSQHHAIQLAIQSKNQLVPVEDKGLKVLDLKEGTYTYSGDIPRIGNYLALLEMQLTLMKLNRMARKVPLDNPKNCLFAPKWDAMTAHSWIESNLSSLKTKVMVEGALRVILGVQLAEISFLYLLYYIHSSKDFQNLITVENGLQQKKTSKGTQHMSIYLSEQIKKLKGNIKLNFKVKHIKQTNKHVIITGDKGDIVEGNYLVMAMPPPNVSQIQFSPPLSVQRRMLCERSFMGNIAKIILLYPEAFWKNKGFSGQVLSDCFNGPAMNVFDDSRKNQKGQIQPALVVFVGGAVYREWKERSDFERVLVQKLAEYFNETKMLHPIQVFWHRWEEKTSMGGPVANFPPGVLAYIDDLRKHEGLIHWAGTQMANQSVGFMDGAIQSGKRVSKQLIKRIKEGLSEFEDQIFKIPASYSRLNTLSSIPFMNRLFEWW